MNVKTLNFQPFLSFLFITDGSVANRGFSVNFTTSESHCGGIIKDQANGIIQSPTDTEFYPHGADCVWAIRCCSKTTW